MQLAAAAEPPLAGGAGARMTFSPKATYSRIML